MKRLLSFLFSFCVCTAVVLYVLYEIGLRINITPSLPRGLYLIDTATPVRGDYVTFCLEKSIWTDLASTRGYLAPGSCPSGLRPLLKQLAGMPGDNIIMTDEGIIVSSAAKAVCWPAPIRKFDVKGRPLPKRPFTDSTIPKGMALVMAGHPGSFDSRIFGLVPLSSLTRVEPVLTF